MRIKTDKPGTRKPTRLRGKKGRGSYLAEKTTHMERTRRELEQEGNRRLARVIVTEHELDQSQTEDVRNENRQERRRKMHRKLAHLQRFDGSYGRKMTYRVTDDPEAMIKLENAEREQEKEKQLRMEHQLGNTPQFSSKLRPRGF